MTAGATLNGSSRARWCPKGGSTGIRGFAGSLLTLTLALGLAASAGAAAEIAPPPGPITPTTQRDGPGHGALPVSGAVRAPGTSPRAPSTPAVDPAVAIGPAIELLLAPTDQIFSDGFELGNTVRWSLTVP